MCIRDSFFLGNGVLPHRLAAYLKGSGLLGGERHEKHCAHVWDVMRDFRDGRLRPDAEYWCMHLQRSVRVQDPACMWARGAPDVARADMYWEPAKRVLLPRRPLLR